MAAIGACRLRGKERERGKGKFVRWVEEEASKVHSHTEPAEGRGKGEVGGGRVIQIYNQLGSVMQCLHH